MAGSFDIDMMTVHPAAFSKGKTVMVVYVGVWGCGETNRAVQTGEGDGMKYVGAHLKYGVRSQGSIGVTQSSRSSFQAYLSG